MTLSIAPLGAALDSDEWQTIGTAADLTLATSVSETEEADDQVRLFTRATSETMTLSLAATAAAFRALTGRMDAAADAAPAFAFAFEYDVPYTGPVAPRKRRGLTGKRYRQARRRYHRQRVRWERAGRPDTAQVRIHMPRVQVTGIAAHEVEPAPAAT